MLQRGLVAETCDFCRPFPGSDLLAGFAPDGQALGPLDPVHPFVIDDPSFARQQDMEPPMAKTRALLGQPTQPSFQIQIFILSRAVTVVPLS